MMQSKGERGRREAEKERERESNPPFQVMVLEDIYLFLHEVLTQKKIEEKIYSEILKYCAYKQ